MKAKLIEHIEAFLDGQISREELQEQAKGQEVTDLDQEIEWVKDTRIAVGAAGLRDQLQASLSKATTKETPVRRLRYLRPLMAIAASVLVLVIAYWGFLRTETNDLYAQYEYVDPGLPVLMSQSEEYELLDALTYYGEGNYAEAAEKLEQLQPTYPNNDTLTYYLAASLLYQGHPSMAEPYLNVVVAQDDSEFQERAQWLLVLSALRDEQTTLAAERLRPVLAAPDHPFFAEATRLQEAITQ